MNLISNLKQSTAACIQKLYNVQLQSEQVLVNATKPEFEGDYTVVLFSLVKSLRLSPDTIGNQLGEKLVGDYPEIFSTFNIIKGFLNLNSNFFY